MRTALAVVALMCLSLTWAVAQAQPGGLDALKATPEQVAPLKAVLDDLWAKAKAKDAAGITNLLHEKSAFWQMEGPQSAKLIHRDEVAEMLTAQPMPETITLGEAKAWVSGDFALVGAPLAGLPADMAAAEQPVLGALMVRTGGQWQIVTADFIDLSLKAPALEGATEDESKLMQQTFADFQEQMMAQGAGSIFDALLPEGAVVGWDPQNQRLMVMQAKELQGMMDVVRQVNVTPADDPEILALYGGGVALMAATVNMNMAGMTIQTRAIMCAGYQPQDGKWHVFAVAAVPLPQ
jgi:hypothetical protein